MLFKYAEEVWEGERMTERRGERERMCHCVDPRQVAPKPSPALPTHATLAVTVVDPPVIAPELWLHLAGR